MSWTSSALLHDQALEQSDQISQLCNRAVSYPFIIQSLMRGRIPIHGCGSFLRYRSCEHAPVALQERERLDRYCSWPSLVSLTDSRASWPCTCPHIWRQLLFVAFSSSFTITATVLFRWPRSCLRISFLCQRGPSR